MHHVYDDVALSATGFCLLYFFSNNTFDAGFWRDFVLSVKKT